MEGLFWVSALLVLYPYLGYPLLLWLLGFVRGKTPARDEQYEPRVTLLISAYNEEKVIAEKLENSLALDYPREKLEIVVASESTDGTNAIVESYRDRGVQLYLSAGRRGKAATLAASVPRASGEIVVFSDANALYARDALRMLVRNFADPRLGCVSGRLLYGCDAGDPAGACESLYWDYERVVKRLESRLFALLGANGSIFALRKELYAPLSEVRGDDFELPVRVLLQGRGAVLEPAALSREKPTASTAAEFRRRVRIVAWNFTSACWLARQAARQGSLLLFVQLVSHRLLRWLGPVFLVGLLGGSAAAAGELYRTALAGQLLFYAAAALGWLWEGRRPALPRWLRLPYYFCAMQGAALVGVGRVLAAPPTPLWERVR